MKPPRRGMARGPCADLSGRNPPIETRSKTQPKSSGILTGRTLAGGRLVAAWDEAAHHVTGEARASRLAAVLAPFRKPADARAALLAAGCMAETIEGANG